MQKSYALSATGAATGPADAGAGLNYRGCNLRVAGTASDSVVALESSPDNSTWTEQVRVTGPNWCTARSDLAARYLRPNVVSLGTGGAALAAVVTAVSAS
jgi:hypothetical protein